MRPWVIPVTGIGLVLLTAPLRMHRATPRDIDWYANGKTVTLTGTVSDVPDRRAAFTQYTIATESMRSQPMDALKKVSGLVLVTDFGGWPRYEYGDVLEITGKLEKPKPTASFAYDATLERFGIFTVMQSTSIERVGTGNRNRILGALFAIRTRFEDAINRVEPEPHASFLAGLLVGSRRGIPRHLTRDFAATGLSHIVAISGTNITIVITVVSALLFFLPGWLRFTVVTIAITAFTLLVGSSASAVRALVMGLIGLLALHSGRLRSTRMAILWAAFLMLLWNPLLLWEDAGFQLSFLAVIGITEASPVLKRLLKWVPATLGLRDALVATLAAQLFTLPWIVYLFGQLTFLSPLANVLAAPFVPLSMLFGFLGTVLSIIYFPLGQCVGYIGWLTMEVIIRIATMLAAVPFSTIEITHLSTWIIALIEGNLVLVLTMLRRNQRSALERYSAAFAASPARSNTSARAA